MSPMHCNFMINMGAATSHDLETLGEIVRARVLENSGIRLEWEIKRIGLFRPGHEVQEFMGRMLFNPTVKPGAAFSGAQNERRR